MGDPSLLQTRRVALAALGLDDARDVRRPGVDVAQAAIHVIVVVNVVVVLVVVTVAIGSAVLVVVAMVVEIVVQIPIVVTVATARGVFALQGGSAGVET